MASRGSWIVESDNQKLLDADPLRVKILIQKSNDIPAWFAFGERAVEGKGIVLRKNGDVITVKGDLAALTVRATGIGATGTYQIGNVDVHSVA